MTYMTNNNNLHSHKNHDDEIDIGLLLHIIWQGRLLIFVLTAIFSIIAVIYSLSLSNIYQSKALLSSVNEDSGINIGSNSGLASIAGINLSSQQGGNSVKALEKIKTLSFFEQNILPNIFLPDLMAIDAWNEDTNTISYNQDNFNLESKSLIEIPTAQESFKVFMSQLDLSQHHLTGFITISVKHQSPYIAKEWTELVINEINNFFRTKDKAEARKALEFLNSQIAQTSYTEIKQVIAEIIQQKMKQLTLIEANEFYVFSYIDPPAVMEEKIEPRRSSISILGAVIGLVSSILIILIRQFISGRSKE